MLPKGKPSKIPLEVVMMDTVEARGIVNIIPPHPAPHHAIVEIQGGEGLVLDLQTDLIVAAVAVAVVAVLAVVAHHQLSGAAVQYTVNMKATTLVAVMATVIVVAGVAVVGGSDVEEDPPAAAGIVAEPRPDSQMERAKPNVMSLPLHYLSFLNMLNLTLRSGRIISKVSLSRLLETPISVYFLFANILLQSSAEPCL